MACNCGQTRRNLGATTPEIVAMQRANEAAQKAAEDLLVKQAEQIAAGAAVAIVNPEAAQAS